ncbi:MAG: VWA domain-containing protein [Verrucomicrobia bacterium]|jgi:uncharacterized membrane protein|nr:VWA domain-containing protein [Verrucomicrobiota bacterium]
MSYQFTHPWFLACALVALPWVVYWARHSDVQIGPWRRGSVLSLRLIITVFIILALAGLQWLRPLEGMNLIYLLDRSESIPPIQKEAALQYVQRTLTVKEDVDQAGVVVFGSEAALELPVLKRNELPAVQSVIDNSRTDIGAAIRLATAAFPENGQKRIVLLSDGNENLGESLPALRSALPLDVTLDVYPMGAQRGQDVSVQRIGVPSIVKSGTAFDAKIFATADQPEEATLRLFINDQLIGEEDVQLEPGKNLFAVPQMLTEPGFYTYDVQLIADGDSVAQNNRAIGFATVRGDPRLLLISEDLSADANLIAALESSQLSVVTRPPSGLPQTLPELQSFDSIFLSNVASGDFSMDQMRLLQSAVRDFGVGLICIGGDQSLAAGGYRGTPLETMLPLDMELSSKKVLPNGALAMVMHGMEFNNGNQIARQVAVGVMNTMAPQDELGIVLWDGSEKWLFPLTPVKDKQGLGRAIMGMNQGDLPDFQNIMDLAYKGLLESNANIKHMIIFSDGDPGAPSKTLMDDIVRNKITVTTILIAGHAGPDTMQWIAENGRGRFYEVQNPNMLPQIFMKEAAVILKSAIIENPFKPVLTSSTEPVRGISPEAYPQLLGYVGSSPKPRAEVPLISDQGDPIFAHWQYGLGRSAAFTSDARPKWANPWMAWDQYRQFWTQIARWSLRRVENSDFTTEVTVDKGVGSISVEAIDEEGQFRNFLDLRAKVVSPTGESQDVRLEQTSPGRYEVKFPAKEVGAYTVNLSEYEAGKVKGMQVIGASVNFSPEYLSSESNMHLLSQMAEEGQGILIEPDNQLDNPYSRDRKRTFQARDLWPWLLMSAILLFPVDVGIRRIQLEPEELKKAWEWIREHVFFIGPKHEQAKRDEAMEALLNRRNAVRAKQSKSVTSAPRSDLFAPESEETIILNEELSQASAKKVQKPKVESDKGHSGDQKEEDDGSMASRLLAAKRKNKPKS